ncbi:hypothetical protein RRG08_064980 [Elysia crispata]|uniref:Uncharacterized protein n=1 Tax=Elysia crispata TaxID=231223 RepID=A0AAE0Y9P8_9GAST|nr:hypothetical protein RRG08_064980 [Elysia crispata]
MTSASHAVDCCLLNRPLVAYTCTDQMSTRDNLLMVLTQNLTAFLSRRLLFVEPTLGSLHVHGSDEHKRQSSDGVNTKLNGFPQS